MTPPPILWGGGGGGVLDPLWLILRSFQGELKL